MILQNSDALEDFVIKNYTALYKGMTGDKIVALTYPAGFKSKDVFWKRVATVCEKTEHKNNTAGGYLYVLNTEA